MAQATARSESTKAVKLKLTPPEHRELKVAAALRGLTMSQFVAEAAAAAARAVEERQEAVAS
jgi:uncharacterized protein (DUF1778 family)